MRAIGPQTLAWVSRQLEPWEHVVGVQALRGGTTCDVRRVRVASRAGGDRHLVLRTCVAVKGAADQVGREARALNVLAGTGVPAPALVAADPDGAYCEHPSLLMTHLPGRPVLDDDGVDARLPLLADQLVAIHSLRPAERPPTYVTLTTADTVVVPPGADRAAWSAAIDVIRRPTPRGEGRFLHRDLNPGNVLFVGSRITGVVDWAATSWGPVDLDVAHCAANLALLHGPQWGLRFPDAYEHAGGAPATARSGRHYWLVRDALALSEETHLIARAWRAAGRTDLTTRTVEQRLDAYVTALMDALS